MRPSARARPEWICSATRGERSRSTSTAGRISTMASRNPGRDARSGCPSPMARMGRVTCRSGRSASGPSGWRPGGDRLFPWLGKPFAESRRRRRTTSAGSRTSSTIFYRSHARSQVRGPRRMRCEPAEMCAGCTMGSLESPTLALARDAAVRERHRPKVIADKRRSYCRPRRRRSALWSLKRDRCSRPPAPSAGRLAISVSGRVRARSFRRKPTLGRESAPPVQRDGGKNVPAVALVTSTVDPGYRDRAVIVQVDGRECPDRPTRIPLHPYRSRPGSAEIVRVGDHDVRLLFRACPNTVDPVPPRAHRSVHRQSRKSDRVRFLLLQHVGPAAKLLVRD